MIFQDSRRCFTNKPRRPIAVASFHEISKTIFSKLRGFSPSFTIKTYELYRISTHFKFASTIISYIQTLIIANLKFFQTLSSQQQHNMAQSYFLTPLCPHFTLHTSLSLS
mmetsp:Transcript_22621/g.31923  ORF Transcript_22621/g.31923 Transcript_22621/m.31923 type:complete len:110 (-) Transcript_22621:412-741(-)